MCVLCVCVVCVCVCVCDNKNGKANIIVLPKSLHTYICDYGSQRDVLSKQLTLRGTSNATCNEAPPMSIDPTVPTKAPSSPEAEP